MNRLHPLGKLLVCVIYIALVASFHKYALAQLILMAVYPVFGFILGELSLKKGLYRMRLILPLVIFVGIFNPFFDKAPLYIYSISEENSFGIQITGGQVSMITLMLKGFYSVLAAYILIATTSIDEICYALRLIHVPKVVVIVIMLIYRYFGLMGNEADRIATAYKLRAPSQNGIHYKAWGTLVGQWLLRSIDRAGVVYESMLLRGLRGDLVIPGRKAGTIDMIYPIAWILVFVAIRVNW